MFLLHDDMAQWSPFFSSEKRLWVRCLEHVYVRKILQYVHTYSLTKLDRLSIVKYVKSGSPNLCKTLVRGFLSNRVSAYFIFPNTRSCLRTAAIPSVTWNEMKTILNIVGHTYVCTYIPMCVPTYLCMYLHTYVCTYIPMYVPTYLCMYLHTYVCTYIPMYVPTYLCMYLGTYLST
jgi:hypothetical protein